MMSMLRGVACGLWIAGLLAAAAAQTPDATLRSTPNTVIWGYLTADLPPALTIKSGQTVKIDTVSHQGLMTKDDPAGVSSGPRASRRVRCSRTPRTSTPWSGASRD